MLFDKRTILPSACEKDSAVFYGEVGGWDNHATLFLGIGCFVWLPGMERLICRGFYQTYPLKLS